MTVYIKRQFHREGRSTGAEQDGCLPRRDSFMIKQTEKKFTRCLARPPCTRHSTVAFKNHSSVSVQDRWPPCLSVNIPPHSSNSTTICTQLGTVIGIRRISVSGKTFKHYGERIFALPVWPYRRGGALKERKSRLPLPGRTTTFGRLSFRGPQTAEENR